MQQVAQKKRQFQVYYVAILVPTYLLPLLGSSDGNQRFLFFVHLLCLVILCLITWSRGNLIHKQWIVIFPMIAMIFDLMPSLTHILLVPTLMHMGALVCGTMSPIKLNRLFVKTSAKPQERRK